MTTLSEATNRGKEYWIPCECGCEGLHIEKDAVDGDIYFALWLYGYQTLSIRHKLSWIWSIIKGRPFHDLIVVDPSRVQDIIDVLEEMKP